MSLTKINSGDSKYSESEGETKMSVNPSVDHSFLSNYKSNHSQKQKRIRNNRQKSPLEQIEGLKWAADRIIDPNRNLRSISQNRDAFIQNNKGGLINQNSSNAQRQFLFSQDKFKHDDEQLNEERHSYQKMSFVEVPIMLGRNNNLGQHNRTQINQKDIQQGDKESRIDGGFEKINLRKQQFNELASMNEEEIMIFFRSYVVHNSENTPIQQIIDSIHLKIENTKQYVYFGEVINRQHIGKGIMLYPNGRVYEGEWQNDCKFGKGYELFPNENEYEGYYVNGKSEGVGTYTWANKEVYQGQWLGGFKHGSGIWRGRKGDSYIGEWNRGKADGYGVHTWQNGDRYEGEFKGCLKHGNGNEKFSNGDSYSGMYVNGRPEGQGQYYWSNGSFYVGEFKNGLRHGKGIWRKDNMVGGQSEQYEGEYQNDKKCGKGVFIWKSGNQYCGNFFDDLRDGYGEMYWKDGTTYKGNWSKGIQSGEGEVSATGQPILKGIFKGSEFQGNTNSHQAQYKDQQTQKNFLDTLNENRSNRQQISNQRNQKIQNYPSQIQGKHKADKMLHVPSILQYSEWKGQSKANNSQPQYHHPPPGISQIQDSIIYPQRQERNSNFLGNQISSREEEQLAILSDLTNFTHLNQENDISYELESTSKNLNNRFVGNNLNNQHFSISNNISTTSTISPLNRFKLSPIRLKTEQLSPKSSYSPYKPFIKIKTKSQNSNKIIRDPSPVNYQSSSFIYKTSNSNKKISTPSQLTKLRSITPTVSMCNSNHSKNSHKKILPSLVSPQKSHSSQSPKYSNKDKNKIKILLKKHEILVWNSLRPKLCIPNNALNNLKDKQIVEKIREILHPPLWKPAGLHLVQTSPEKENKSRSGSR